MNEWPALSDAAIVISRSGSWFSNAPSRCFIRCHTTTNGISRADDHRAEDHAAACTRRRRRGAEQQSRAADDVEELDGAQRQSRRGRASRWIDCHWRRSPNARSVALRPRPRRMLAVAAAPRASAPCRRVCAARRLRSHEPRAAPRRTSTASDREQADEHADGERAAAFRSALSGRSCRRGRNGGHVAAPASGRRATASPSRRRRTVASSADRSPGRAEVTYETRQVWPSSARDRAVDARRARPSTRRRVAAAGLARERAGAGRGRSPGPRSRSGRRRRSRRARPRRRVERRGARDVAPVGEDDDHAAGKRLAPSVFAASTIAS